MKINWRKEGKRYEEIAKRYLENKGYQILASNVNTPFGELDLIARNGESLVFIEVKGGETRGGLRPAFRVGRLKQERIKAAASYFLQDKNVTYQTIRFDVIELRPELKSRLKILHLKDAFRSDED